MNDKPTINPIGITPFKHFCMTIGELPSSYLETMTYYEMILWFTKFLQEKMIPALDNNALAVKELQDLYLELQQYVNNYFDNLDVQEEINNKLDEMVESGQFQEIIEEYIATKVDYFYIDENSTFTDIKNAFESNKTKIIEFKKGTYTLTNRIYLTSNTQVYLNDSTLNSEYLDEYSDNLVFLGYPYNSTYTDYNGVSNVKFYNGKINTSFALMHNTNIEFNNINFNNINAHALQIGGCKDIKILNCIFNGTIIDDEHGASHELIQLERAGYGGQPYLPEESPSYDETGNFNIIIDNCVFNKGNEVTTRNYVCIGHHSYSEDYPYYNENIKITNCFFDESNSSDISGGSFNNLIISNNNFYRINEIASNVHCRLRWYNKNVHIYNNIFTGKTAIQNVNIKQQENIHIYNNDIKLNQIGVGMYLNSVKNCYIHDNYIKNNGYGITISRGNETDDVSNINIYNNKFNMKDINAERNGINLVYGDDVIIENNIIELNSNRAFIYLNGNNTTNYLFRNNKIITNQSVPYYIDGTNINYEQIYNMYKSIYSGNATTSYSIINQNPSVPFAKFNRLSLLLHKTGSTSTMLRVILEPYGVYGKFDDRTYPMTMVIDNVVEYALLKINEDGTFNFSSSNNSIVLRNMYGYNE